MKKDKELLSKVKVDGILISNLEYTNPNANIKYFSGYGGSGFFLISKKGNVLIVPKMEINRAKKEYKGKIIRWKDPVKDLRKIIKSKGIRRIGLDKGMTYSLYIRLKGCARFSDVQKECLHIREIKDKKEIKLLEKTGKITDLIFDRLIRNFRFITENEAKNFILRGILDSGCDPSFAPIVPSGKNAGTPHWDSSGKMRKGFCVVDFGVKYQGYCSDMSRTLYLGKPSKKDMVLYNKIKDLQVGLIEIIKEGRKCSKVAKMAKMALGNKMNHSLGHGIGLDVHELPRISVKSKEIFRNGMCFTIEPGYYTGDRGIRIEDTMVLTKKGAKPLTKSKKELIIKRFK